MAAQENASCPSVNHPVVAADEEIVKEARKAEEAREWKAGRSDKQVQEAFWGHAEKGELQQVLMAWACGVDINAGNPKKDGKTALMYAARNGHTPVVVALVEGGAKLDLHNTDGGTALMYAAMYGHDATVQALVNAGAKTSLKSKYHKTALNFAKEKNHAGCVAILSGRVHTLTPPAKAEKHKSDGVVELEAQVAQLMKDDASLVLVAGGGDGDADNDYEWHVCKVTDSLNGHSGPGQNFDVIATLELDAKVEVKDKSHGNWWCVEGPHGKKMWVHSGYLEQINLRVMCIEYSAGWYLDSITLHFSNGTSAAYGKPGPTPKVKHLDTGERLVKCVQYLHNEYLGAGITFFTSSGQELDFHGTHVDVSRKETFEDPGNGITSLVFNGHQLSSVKGPSPDASTGMPIANPTWTLSNPAYSQCSASSVYSNNAIGDQHGLGRLDSSRAWSSKHNSVGQWWQIDVGSILAIAGVRTQGRIQGSATCQSQRVTSFKVYASTDSSSWWWVGNGQVFTGNSDSNTYVDNEFGASISARYIRIYPQTWNSHMSMRSALLMAPGAAAEPSTPAVNPNYGLDTTTLGTDPATCPMTTEQIVEKCENDEDNPVNEVWPKLLESNGGSEDFSKAALTKFLSGMAKEFIMETLKEDSDIPDELRDSITSNQAIVTELINSLDLTLPKVTTAVFNLFDKDHDGVITKREFFWFWAHLGQLLSGPEAAQEFVIDFIFKLLDENGNGTIEANEVGAFIRTILEFGANIAKHLLGIIPKVLDSPNVNLAEHIGKVFSVLDVDHGGTLSLKELTAPFDDPTSISDPFFQGQIARTLGMMDAQLSDSTNSMKEAEAAISAIAGLPAGTFLDASEAMKAEFMECAVGGKVAKDVAVNILLKHQYAPLTKLIDALKGIVMQHAEAPYSQLSARFTSSLRTGIDSFEQWLVGGGMTGCMVAACDLFDANGDGMISIDELEQMFTKPQSMSEMLTLLFSIGDADGDGELTKDEVMGLVHRYVNLLVAVMELMIDVCVETALAVAKPLLTAILEAYESPLGFTMETVRILVNEGPEAGAGRLQILAMLCQSTAMIAMQSAEEADY